MYGDILSPKETLKLSDYVRLHGVKQVDRGANFSFVFNCIQLIYIYKTCKDRSGDPFKWGDEMEYIIVKQENGKTKLALKGQTVLKKLRRRTTTGTWFAEATEFNLESSPLHPYNNNVSQWLNMEENLIARRKEAEELVDKDEYVLSFCTFPRVGCPNFTGIIDFMFFKICLINGIIQNHPTRLRIRNKMKLNVPTSFQSTQLVN